MWEARQLRAAANKYKVATQMGNQGYSNEGTRQCAEIVWTGDIGARERSPRLDAIARSWPQGLTEIPHRKKPPATLDWDLWLGSAEKRPFTAGGPNEPDRWGGFFYQPFNWRGFYDFGCGAIGDMACHILGAPNMALHLGQTQARRRRVHQEGRHQPLHVPARSPSSATTSRPYGNMPALKVFWYDGMKQNPKIAGVPEGEWLGDPPFIIAPPARWTRPRPPGLAARARPRHIAPPAMTSTPPAASSTTKTSSAMKNGRQPQLRFPTPNGSVFVGDKGILTTGTYGEVTRLLPVEKMKRLPACPTPMLTRSPGHMRDFIRACKGGDPACSNFDVAAPFVEWMLLGVIALRHEGKLEYDPEKMRITNNVEANKLLKPVFRKGWEFHTVKS
ncbi:MAG: gfo/Idh/MocA family oxidoreductase [Paludibaculum sp.]